MKSCQKSQDLYCLYMELHDIGGLQPLLGVAGCMRTRGRSHSSSSHPSLSRLCTGPVLAASLSVIAAAQILGLACLFRSDRVAESSSGPSTSHHSVMVVRYACMACHCAPTYFTTYQRAADHYACSLACQQSLRGIATVVLPNRPTDQDAGGSGAAGVWAGPRNPPEVERRVPARALQVPE